MSVAILGCTLPTEVAIPPSKSQTLRGILLATFARGTSRIKNFLNSPDTHKVIEACRGLGAQIHIGPNEVIIEGTHDPRSGSYDLGNSGIALRFLTALLDAFDGEFELYGDHSLMRRPMQPLLRALESQTNNTFHVDGSDSQMVSALIYRALLEHEPVTIHVSNPGELPWIDLSLSWLKRFGIAYTNHAYSRYHIEGRGYIEAFDYSVPGDMSSASYPLAAALLTGSEITLTGLDFTDPQGDQLLFACLEQMGAKFERAGHTLHVPLNQSLHGIDVDINRFIDALPLLAVIATQASSPTKITGATIARTKECDRIHASCLELTKMGANVHELDDGLIIEPLKKPSLLKGAQLSSHGDQRMVMALAIAALVAEGQTQIDNFICYQKTFPNFFSALNFDISVL